MSMRKRPTQHQADLWIATGELARSPGHPFYERLNRLLSEAGFDRFVEERCARFYAEGKGRPSIATGVYMRSTSPADPSRRSSRRRDAGGRQVTCAPSPTPRA